MLTTKTTTVVVANLANDTCLEHDAGSVVPLLSILDVVVDAKDIVGYLFEQNSTLCFTCSTGEVEEYDTTRIFVI